MKKYLFIIIAVLLLAVGILTAVLISVSKEKNRISENFKVEVTGQMSELQTLTKQELKKYHNVYITDRSFSDSILIALYKKRKCLFQKPTYKAIAISSCSGDTLQILNNIKVQK